MYLLQHLQRRSSWSTPLHDLCHVPDRRLQDCDKPLMRAKGDRRRRRRPSRSPTGPNKGNTGTQTVSTAARHLTSPPSAGYRLPLQTDDPRRWRRYPTERQATPAPPWKADRCAPEDASDWSMKSLDGSRSASADDYCDITLDARPSTNARVCHQGNLASHPGSEVARNTSTVVDSPARHARPAADLRRAPSAKAQHKQEKDRHGRDVTDATGCRHSSRSGG